MMQPMESTTALRPPWLYLARVAWLVLSALAVLIFAIGTFNQLREPLPSCTRPETACTAWVVSQEDVQLAPRLGLTSETAVYLLSAFTLLPRLGLAVVAALIFWRRSNDWMAMLLSISLMLALVEGVQNVGVLLPLSVGLYVIAMPLFAFIPFLFPSGRFVPRWIRWIAIPLAIVLMTGISLSLFWLVNGAWLIYFVIGGYAVFYRYVHVSNALERQQIKWVMTGILGSVLILIPTMIIAVWYPPAQPTLERLVAVLFVNSPIYGLSYILVALTIAIAIMRYRLYDIDILIRRTLQYSLLSGLLALIYFGGIVILQGGFTAITGQAQSPLVTVLSTLAIAALFFPLRRRVQNFIDKRFYRRKYDAAKTLADFAATARDETDLDKLTARLVEVVDETMQPESVGLWLKPSNNHEQKIADNAQGSIFSEASRGK